MPGPVTRLKKSKTSQGLESERMTFTQQKSNSDTASDIGESLTELSYVSFDREVDFLCDKEIDTDQEDKC